MIYTILRILKNSETLSDYHFSELYLHSIFEIPIYFIRGEI